MFEKEFIKKLLVLKTKFAASSGVATIVDVGLFTTLSRYTTLSEPIINVISSLVGMVINFVLQKKFIFELNRKASTVFLLSLAVSLVGIGISTTIIHFMMSVPIVTDFPVIAKLVATGVVFFYNFYMKRFAFEKKFL